MKPQKSTRKVSRGKGKRGSGRGRKNIPTLKSTTKRVV